MVEPERLSLKDVRFLASQLRHKTGIGLAELAQREPWITGYSQDVVREIYGDRFPVWRYLTLEKEKPIQPEGVASVSSNPAWIGAEIRFAPTLYGNIFGDAFGNPGKVIKVEQAILRYELTPERVLVYVPALIHLAMDTYGDTLHKWKATHGEYSMSLHKVFAKILYENREEEMVADLSGLEPQVINFWDAQKQPWWWDRSLVLDIVTGWPGMTPEGYANDQAKRMAIRIETEEDRREAIAYFTEVFRKIEEFFAP